MTLPIPRRVIQTARSRELDPVARAAAVNIRLLHPGWEYLLFDDAAVVQFVGAHFPQYWRVFQEFPHRIQKYDLFRYLAILHFGGFYLDLDVFLADSLDDLRLHGCVFPFEEPTVNSYLRRQLGMGWELGNYAFGASAGHPFLAALAENVARAVLQPAWCAPLVKGIPVPFRADFEVLNTTGPGAVTRTYAERPDLATGVQVIWEGDIRTEASWHRFGRYGVHLMQASWRTKRGFLRRRISQLWERNRRCRWLAEVRSANPIAERRVSLIA